VGAYLNEIGLPDSAVLYITYASPSSMTWLTQADAEKVGIEISPIHSDQSAKTEDEWSDFNPQPQEQPAHAKNEQFIEFPEQNATKVYDLGSVQILLPGKFSIMATTVDSPDVLRLRLRVHDALAAYCKRSDGEYEVPSDLFALGSPDMPIETIVVKTIKSEIDRKPFREATWSLPYKRLAYRFDSGKVDPSSVLYICNAGIDAITIAERNANARSEILSGHRQKEIYDCSHGLMALKLLDPDSRFEPTMDEVRGGYFRYYESLCMKVMRSEPFLSPE